MHPLTEVWWQHFINRTDGTLRQGGNGWRFTSDELTKAEVSAALDFRQSLGVYSVDQEGLSRWLCLDADDEPGRAELAKLAMDLNPNATLFELSRRGAHLWWLCPPTPWQIVHDAGSALLARQGIECEVFPKNAGRNGVRLPLTRHPKTGEVYPIVDPLTGEIRPLSELLKLSIEPLPSLKRATSRPERKRTFEHSHLGFVSLWREIERFTSLRQYGPDRAIGRCPFHDDRHPSLTLLGGFWRCWAGCGQGGISAFRAQVQQRGMR